MAYKLYYGSNALFDPTTDNVVYDAKLTAKTNTSDYLDFTVPYGHDLYDSLAVKAETVKLYWDKDCLYVGTIESIETDIQGNLDITCTGALDWLADSIVRPYSTVEGEQPLTAPTSVDGLFEWYITQHNEHCLDTRKQFNVGENQGALLDENNYVYRSNEQTPTTLDEVQDKIIDELGGYLFVDYEPLTIDLYADVHTTNAQIIDFGVNITDFTSTTDTSEQYTAIRPEGADLYFHLKFSASSNPSEDDMTDTPSAYVGTYVDADSSDSSSPSSYWWRAYGNPGSNGIQGNLSDGTVLYLHVAYANSDDGKTDFSTDDDTNRYYIGQYVDYTQADSTLPYKYEWGRYKRSDDDEGSEGPHSCSGPSPLTIENLADGGVDYGSGDFWKTGDVIYSVAGLARYGYREYAYSNTDCTLPSTLQTSACKALNAILSPDLSITVKAVDLSLFMDGYTHLKVGEAVRVRSKFHGIDEYLMVQSIELDLQDPSQSTYELGAEYSTLTGQQSTYLKNLNSNINSALDATSALSDETKAAASEAKDAKTQAAEAKAAADAAVVSNVAQWATTADPATKPAEDDWSEEAPDYEAGKYIWLRNVITYGSGETSATDGVCITGNTGKGVKGDNAYVHIAYANSADGKTDFSVDDPVGKSYIGQYSDNLEDDSTDPTKYAWTKIKGEQGIQGEKGEQGEQGAAGAKGDKGAGFQWNLMSDSRYTGSSHYWFADADCTLSYMNAGVYPSTETQDDKHMRFVTTAGTRCYYGITGTYGFSHVKGNSYRFTVWYYVSQRQTTTTTLSTQVAGDQTVDTQTVKFDKTWHKIDVTYTANQTGSLTLRTNAACNIFFYHPCLTLSTGNGQWCTTQAETIGADGVSPTATVTKDGDTATITITDASGTTTETVSDGATGATGYGVLEQLTRTGQSDATWNTWGATGYSTTWTRATNTQALRVGDFIQIVGTSTEGKAHVVTAKVTTASASGATSVVASTTAHYYADKGTDGTNGSSVTKVAVTYGLSTSNASDGYSSVTSWTTDIPDWETGKYIWQKSVTTIGTTEQAPVYALYGAFNSLATSVDGNSSKITQTANALGLTFTDSGSTTGTLINADSTGIEVGYSSDGSSFASTHTKMGTDAFSIHDSSHNELASFGTTAVVGQTTGGNVQITSSAVNIRSKTDNMASISSSSAVIGSTSGTNKNVLVNGTQLAFRQGTTTKATIKNVTGATTKTDNMFIYGASNLMLAAGTSSKPMPVYLTVPPDADGNESDTGLGLTFTSNTVATSKITAVASDWDINIGGYQRFVGTKLWSGNVASGGTITIPTAAWTKYTFLAAVPKDLGIYCYGYHTGTDQLHMTGIYMNTINGDLGGATMTLYQKSVSGTKTTLGFLGSYWHFDNTRSTKNMAALYGIF